MLSPSSSKVQSEATALLSPTMVGTESGKIVPVETLSLGTPAIRIIPVGIVLPSSLSSIGGNGIVGSIVVMGGKSAMVWIGWGPLDATGNDSTNPSSFGKGTPTMGQLVVAMPRTNYKGAFATGSKEASCSQLVGNSSSEDQMLANQMASCLSSRSGMAIYVSCQLSSTNTNTGCTGSGSDLQEAGGMDAEMLSHRAAALAEKEIWRILQLHR